MCAFAHWQVIHCAQQIIYLLLISHNLGTDSVVYRVDNALKTNFTVKLTNVIHADICFRIQSISFLSARSDVQRWAGNMFSSPTLSITSRLLWLYPHVIDTVACRISRYYGNTVIFFLLGPFYGAIAVRSVTRCRCCCRCRRCRGHRCAGGVRQ